MNIGSRCNRPSFPQRTNIYLISQRTNIYLISQRTNIYLISQRTNIYISFLNVQIYISFLNVQIYISHFSTYKYISHFSTYKYISHFSTYKYIYLISFTPAFFTFLSFAARFSLFANTESMGGTRQYKGVVLPKDNNPFVPTLMVIKSRPPTFCISKKRNRGLFLVVF
jgi:hypothetical protein